MEKVIIAQKFSLFHEHWSPKIVGELNDSYVKLAKLKGEFVWHRHEMEDELFLVVKGELHPQGFRDGGDLVEGVEHVFQIADIREGMTCPICGMPLKKLSKEEADKLKGVAPNLRKGVYFHKDRGRKS